MAKRTKIAQEPGRSQADFATLMGGLYLGVVLQDESGKILDANPAAQRILGLTLDQMCGRTSMDPRWKAVHEDGSPFPGEEHPATIALRTGRPAQGCVMGVFRPTDETSRWIRVEAFPLFRADRKKPSGVFAIFEDVTETKAAREAVRTSEEQLRLGLRSAAAGMWDWDIQGNKVVWSPDFYELYGLDPARVEPTYTAWADCILPDDRPAATEALKFPMENGLDVFRAEYRILHPSRGIRWIAAIGKFSRDPSGRLLRLTGINLDITDRKAAEQALRQMEFAVEHAADMVLWIQQDGSLSYVNEAVCTQLGFARQELLSLSIPDINPEFPRLSWRAHWEDLRTRKSFRYESVFQRKDGTRFPVELQVNHVSFNGSEFNCALARDISERLKVERDRQEKMRELEALNQQLEDTRAQLVQTEKLAAIGQLASGVAHELNNPLTGVVGFAQLLAKSPNLSAQEQEDVRTIMAQAERCKTIIQNLLQLSRHGDPRFVSVNLLSIVRSTLALIRETVVNRGIEVSVEIPDHLPLLRGDPQKLQQAILNLITNARQAMDGVQNPRLVLRADVSGGWVRLQVIDNGAGIPVEDRARVFDPFFTTRPVGQGTGLGLSVCHGIVERHEGRLRVASEVGQGTTVTIELPVSRSTDAGPQSVGPRAA